jgi:DNA adenine methylase
MRLPQPIPYQGSKRALAPTILAYFPQDVDLLIEPFAGSAAVSVAAAAAGKSTRFLLNDVNRPLMDLLLEIINEPAQIADEYERFWRAQLGHEKEFFVRIRNEFNLDHNPAKMLYLLARCVKGAVRYNASGEFNQSADNRRKGRKPESMRLEILRLSRLLAGKTTILTKDYKEILMMASSADLVYMDPPYQGVCSSRDPRYAKSVSYDEFVDELRELSRREISYIVSYDGRHGNQSYGRQIPSDIGVHRLEINAGRSSQSTLLGRTAITYESLYLSYSLLDRLGLSPDDVGNLSMAEQLPLLGDKSNAERDHGRAAREAS